MCTLTFIPRDNGYCLAMNRDERISRGPAAPPARIEVGGVAAIYPRDTEGGTWIAADARGIAFGLLNWHDPPAVGAKTRSRGDVIPALIGVPSSSDAQVVIDRINLNGVFPFRLVGIFPAEKLIHEWRWNRQALSAQAHPWKAGHWFSSGFSDEQARTQRGLACERAWEENDAGSVAWLRRLHASHLNGPGPFSICVHRDGVETLSYTEIQCAQEQVSCNYFSGTPCTMTKPTDSVALDREPGSVVFQR